MAVNLRSFVRPRAKPTAPLPLTGVLAPALPGVEIGDGRPRIVAFMRHTGCPFAEATMRAARALAQQAPELEIVAVTHSPEQAAARWSEVVGGTGPVRVLSDERRDVYAAWGLGRSSLQHFAGPRSLRGVARQRKTGIVNTRAHGTRWQQAGTFAVDGGGVVRWRHVPAHAGDLPDLDAARRAVVRG